MREVIFETAAANAWYVDVEFRGSATSQPFPKDHAKHLGVVSATDSVPPRGAVGDNPAVPDLGGGATFPATGDTSIEILMIAFKGDTPRKLTGEGVTEVALTVPAPAANGPLVSVVVAAQVMALQPAQWLVLRIATSSTGWMRVFLSK